MFYSDDICVIEYSATQGLLSRFGVENDIEYNPIKSLCMVFKPRSFHLKYPYNIMEFKTNLHMLKKCVVIVCSDLKYNADILRTST